MRSSKIKKINVIITEFFDSSKKKESNQSNPYKIWSKVMGEKIRLQTQSVFLKNNKFTVYIKSENLKTILNDNHSKILIKIRKILKNVNYLEIKSFSEKWKSFSNWAFSSLSEPWIALASIDLA